MPTLQETHMGVVTDNNDPEQRGRLKLKCQSLVAVDVELPDWIEPAAQLFASTGGAAALFLPAIGSTVELTCDVHDTELDEMPGERFLQNPAMKWRPATMTDKAGPMPLPDVLRINYPNRRGWATPSGHYVVCDDKGSVIIHHSGGSEITIDSSGGITVTSPDVKLGDGTAVDRSLKGDTYRTAEDAVLTAIGTFATAVGGALPAVAAAATTLNLAITNFQAAAATYMAQKVKVK